MFEHAYAEGDIGLVRPVARFPFVPDRPEKLDEDCYEAFNIQVDALMRRIESTRTELPVNLFRVAPFLGSPYLAELTINARSATGQPITITDPTMTRFMMTLDDAVDLVLYAFRSGQNGDIFVRPFETNSATPPMNSVASWRVSVSSHWQQAHTPLA